MRLRLPAGLAVALAAVVAGVVAVRLLRRRRELADKARRPALPPGPPVEDRRETDEPISRETRFDELLDEEEQRRQAAARRLQTDPLSRRLEEETP
jgi:negative regulator of sigma E activity